MTLYGLIHFLDDIVGGRIMVNDNGCTVRWIHTIKLKMFEGSSNYLYDIWYIPTLKHNPISFGALKDKYMWQLWEMVS